DTPLLDLDGLARTRTFLVALARWTRRPAEWAHMPPAGPPRRLVLLDSPHPVSSRPPRLDPPARVGLEPLPGPGEAGRRGATPPDVIPAMAIDLDAAGVGTDAYAFCDPAWRAGIAALPADTALGAERRERLRILPVEQRYDTLLEAGLLGDYFGALEQAVA